MIWIKPLSIAYEEEPDTKVALLTALNMKNGPKKRKLEEYVTTVIDERHRALYKAFELINKCIGNTPYSGVYNIRLVGTTRKDTPPTTEFDFVMEDRNKVIYINVEKTDKGNRQLKQIKRNTELLKDLLTKLECSKTIISFNVVTDDSNSMAKLEKILTRIKNDFAGEDNTLCAHLVKYDRPAPYARRIFNQFQISNKDFTEDKRKWILYYFWIKKARPPKERCYCGTVMDVGGIENGKIIYFTITNVLKNNELVNLYVNNAENKYAVDELKKYEGKIMTIFPADCIMIGPYPFIKDLGPNCFIELNRESKIIKLPERE